MTVKPIFIKSIERNGIGNLINSCYKITLQYCNLGGSSNGIRELLKSGSLDEYAKNKQFIFFEIKQKFGHPLLKFYYGYNKINEVNIANLSKDSIIEKLTEFSLRTGNDLIKCNNKVVSLNESVRGIWSPMHISFNHRFRI